MSTPPPPWYRLTSAQPTCRSAMLARVAQGAASATLQTYRQAASLPLPDAELPAIDYEDLVPPSNLGCTGRRGAYSCHGTAKFADSASMLRCTWALREGIDGDQFLTLINQQCSHGLRFNWATSGVPLLAPPLTSSLQVTAENSAAAHLPA